MEYSIDREKMEFRRLIVILYTLYEVYEAITFART